MTDWIVEDEIELAGNPNMEPGTFKILAYGGPQGAVLLRVLDYAPGMEYMEEEAADLGPMLDDCGWNGQDFDEELLVITCKYRAWDESSQWDGGGYETEWNEIARERMRITRRPWWERLIRWCGAIFTR